MYSIDINNIQRQERLDRGIHTAIITLIRIKSGKNFLTQLKKSNLKTLS